jgi:hypothetical protein
MSSGLLSISELRSKWRKESSFYEVREVGTGVEIFVKDVLKSPDVFALKVGLNSTKLENRKHEFLEKKTSKGSRQPDITIFISPEIIIPVEVEKYQNINAGKGQLLQYQIDLEKKYGILTDGYTWRFYNNNEYREYNLETILDETPLFLEFWHEYIKIESYYIAFFEKRWKKSLLQETEQLPVDEYRQLFFEDITKLIASFKSKLDIEGYLKELPKKEKLKTAVEITYAYIIQFILYKTLVDNDFDEFPQRYETLVKSIHGHLRENRFKDILGIIDGISAEISKNIYRPFSQEQKFIADRLLELYHEPQNELRHVSPWLDIFVFIKKYNFAEVRNEIFGYIYENYLKALYEDEKKGQYYTDPAVVNFMLEQIGYTPENLKSRIAPDGNTISLIDPACGSGTFLYSAVDALIRTIGPDSEQRAMKVEELVNKDIFGLDIAEFPLYLAEMNILMRMLPLIINEKYNNPVEKKIKVFKTRDSIAEFMDTALRNTIHDIDVAKQKNNGQGFLFKEKLDLGYVSYVRDEDDLKEMKESLEIRPRCPRRRFDFVIANPPYVSYNECSKQGILIFEWLKKKEVKLNDIYGVNLHSIPHNPKRYRPNPNLYAFFIALGLALLKDNAKLCYIIPQTVLVNPDFDVVRYHLAKFTTIEKIITFGGKMFIGRGLKQNRPVATSSLIFVVRRCQPDRRNYVETINCKDTSDEIETTLQNIREGKKISKKKILQGEFLENITNWNFIKQEKAFIDFYDMYMRATESMSIYYTHTLAKYQFKDRFYFDGGYSIDERELLYKPMVKMLNYGCPRLDNTFWTTRRVAGYWPNIRDKHNQMFIKLRQGNQGYNLLDSKYKVLWSYNNTTRFFFTDIPVIWARNKFLGIGSNNKNEIIYLFGLLNSAITRFLLDNNVRIEQEDRRTILVSLQIIRSQIRVPKIGENNQFVKGEIIKRTEEMLALEEVKLADLVDFSNIMIQKFDAVSVKGDSLVLCKDKKERKLKIKSSKALVEKIITDNYRSEKLKFESVKIKLSELKSLPAIDFEKQESLKDYIDDLVFALYFNIPLGEIGLDYTNEIKKVCQKSTYYQLVAKLADKRS